MNAKPNHYLIATIYRAPDGDHYVNAHDPNGNVSLTHLRWEIERGNLLRVELVKSGISNWDEIPENTHVSVGADEATAWAVAPHRSEFTDAQAGSEPPRPRTKFEPLTECMNRVILTGKDYDRIQPGVRIQCSQYLTPGRNGIRDSDTETYSEWDHYAEVTYVERRGSDVDGRPFIQFRYLWETLKNHPNKKNLEQTARLKQGDLGYGRRVAGHSRWRFAPEGDEG